MKDTILVVTNRTAASEDLFAALRARHERRPARYEFVMPPDRPGPEARREAEQRLEEAIALGERHGLEVSGRVGDPDALLSATEAYDAMRHDGIIVATLPASLSHWLQIDLPARVAQRTGAMVSHVTARPARAPQAQAS
jgi:hypothetical protein